ncbi:MAG: hypothetical protein KDA97_04060 [Acidimicrobiales bacterium]|nr:hypothetical protein [Acidimicrobiales bacterium]
MRRPPILAAAATCLALGLAACQPAPGPEVLVPTDPPETATVVVTVVHDGQPVADAQVRAILPSGPWNGPTGTTDEAGQVTLQGEPGRWHVGATGLREPHPTDPLCTTSADGTADVAATADATTEVTVELVESGVYACA